MKRSRLQGVRGALRLTLLTLTLGSAGHVRADTLPLPNWNTAERPTYVRVPPYQQYTSIRLSLDVARALPGIQAVNLLLDGRKVAHWDWPPTGSLLVPDLAPGIHELRLQSLNSVTPGTCAAIGEALPLRSAELQFKPVTLDSPTLADLPHGLFTPDLPVLAVGTMQADNWTDEVLGAALGVTQALSGARPVLWQAEGAASLPADFTVQFRQQASLSQPLRLTLRPAKLSIEYREGAALKGLTSWLTPDKRRDLTSSRADLTPQPLAPVDVRPPQTLAEYGLGEYQVWSGSVVKQAVVLPPLWEPGGPVTGELRYRLPAGASGTALELQLGQKRVNVSPDRAPRGIPDEVRVPFQTDAIGSGDGLPLDLLSRHIGPDCSAPLRVLPDSAVDFHARARDGIAALPRSLAKNPTVEVTDAPQTISLVLNIVGSFREWGLSDLLPWDAHLLRQGEGGRSRRATLLVRQDAAATADYPLITAKFPALALVAPNRYEIVARDPQALWQLAQSWSRVPGQLRNRMYAAQVQPGGEVLSGRELAQETQSDRAAWLALGWSLLTLPLLGFWFWWRGRRQRRALEGQ